LIWNPWRRTSLAILEKFKFKVIVAIARLPLHARNLEVAQTILGPSCANLSFTEFRDTPMIDDREFFVSAWCWHPRLIHEEQIIFIPDPAVPGIAPPVDHLSGLRYLVRTRLVAYQDWTTPPPSPSDDVDVDDGQPDDLGAQGGPAHLAGHGPVPGDGPGDGEVEDMASPGHQAGRVNATAMGAV
jgi:hypothetical protein